MDTLTHAVIGALVIRAPKPSFFARSGLNETARIAVVATASAFPDLDYASFGFDPYQFITQWHRGITHSLLLLPVWAALLGFLIAFISGRTDQRNEICCLCGLGLLLHIITDLMTIFGTQIFSPLSDYRIGLGFTFDIDPWVAFIATTSLGLSFYRRNFARYGIFLLALYLSLAVIVQLIAIQIAEDQHPNTSVKSVHAIAHPFSPLHRSLVIETNSGYWLAHLDLSKFEIWLKVFDPADTSGLRQYSKKENLHWIWHNKPENSGHGQIVAYQVWHHVRMRPFRLFARLPVVYRIDRDRDTLCVWFADLRYTIPGFITPFRYGMCRDKSNLDWQMFRLKRLTKFEREPLH